MSSLAELKEHLRHGFRTKLDLLKVQWKLAVWLRPMVPSPAATARPDQERTRSLLPTG